MTKMKILIIGIIALSFLQIIQAQTIQYDPLSDSNVKVSESLKKRSQGEYLWYPGQLSAHLQQRRLRESQARCVNVGYPGKFYAPVFKTFFRKDVNLPADTEVKWESTGNVTIFIDGKDMKEKTGSGRLPEGKSTLLFEVETENNLPSIKISFNGKYDAEGWQASLDGNSWNFAEYSPVFGTNGKMPLDDSEVSALIDPASIIPIRNAIIGNDKVIIRKNGYVLVDFFHLEVGKVSFKVKGKGKLTAFIGESPEEALNENIKFFEQIAIEPYALSDNETLITLPERALRYVNLFCDEDCEISNIEFTAKIWPVDFQMTFECDDKRINNIWNASVTSLHTGMHGFYLDGIKRDYLPWSMDAVLSTFGGDYVFADKQVSLNSLSVALLPYNPTKDDLGIPDYPLHALIGFNQFYKRYGDLNAILSYRDRMEQLLRFYETIQDERGFISANVGVSWGFVPGWATRRGPDRKGTPTYAQIMLYFNYKIGADFSEKWGDKQSAKHYRIKAEELRKSIVKHFWNEEKGLFINGYTKDGKLDETISHHAQYWAILAGIFPEEQYDNLFETLLKIPYYKDYVSFEKGYEFIAYSKAGKTREMWNFLFDVFGDWLDQGHTRFPENFQYKKTKNEQLVFYNRPYGLSLCHGANGIPGIVAVLHGITGFSQSDTHLNHYTIRPDMMDLNWANVEFPVKEGKIKLKLSKNGINEIEIPAGCKVEFIGNGKSKTFSKQGIYRL